MNQSRLLAFVHIEKAAGTTLIHILRHNFFLQYLDVRPYSKESHGIFTASDLNIARKMVPRLRCISGHAVKPFSDLESCGIDIKYITLMRKPVDRYISQFKYWTDKLGKKLTFEQFLAHEKSWNFQTKKISGSEDVELAKSILAERFLLVGTVERFEEFLFLLRKRLEPTPFDARHRRKNLSRRNAQSGEFYQKYAVEIEARNTLDQALYDFAEATLFPRYVAEYGNNFQRDFDQFESSLELSDEPMLRRRIDYIFRKLYVEPVGGVVRIIHGLPAVGSY